MARDNSRRPSSSSHASILALRPNGRELFLGAWRSLLPPLGPAKASPLIRLARTTGRYPETGLGKLLRWFPLMPDTFPACLRAPRTNYWQLLEAGRLFEDIQESSRAIDSVTLRIAYPFHDIRTFQSVEPAIAGAIIKY
jgi:hypothetical protein